MKSLGLQTVKVADIQVGDRLRSIDEAYAALLAENIHQVGRLRQPIEVRQQRRGKGIRYTLVAGGKARQGSATDMMSVAGFDRDTAERCGLTDRTIRRAVAIAAGIEPDLRARMAGTWLARNQSELLALSGLTATEQRAALDLLLAANPTARTVEQAKKLLMGVHDERSDVDKQFGKLRVLWGRTSAEARRVFLAHLRETKQLTAPQE